VPPQKAEALRTWVEKGKSDCGSVELAITLLYGEDNIPEDNNSEDNEKRDYFELVIFDAEWGGFVALAEASLTEEQSPFYWQTHRIEGAASGKGVYRIEVWDKSGSGDGKRTKMLDKVYLQCFTGNMWRDNPTGVPDYGDIPFEDCFVRTLFTTTNVAPEDGVVMILWSYGTTPQDPLYHVQTIEVKAGDYFDDMEVEVPCGTYIKVFFQPHSNKLLYYMPSQYYPHDFYGAAEDDDEHSVFAPTYHTFFPLDGEIRPDFALDLDAVPTQIGGDVLPTATPIDLPDPVQVDQP
jgi:hypothetical protein